MLYTGAFVKVYNWRSRKLVYETHEIVKLKKHQISKTENLLNLSGQQFYKISKVLQIAYIIPKDTEDNTFYLNIYIDWDQCNQLYNPEWQTKRTQSINIIVQKLMPALKKVIEPKQKAGTRAA